MWQRSLREKSDQEIVAECLAGKTAAWEVLIARYQGFIFGIALQTGFSPADADDIFQNVSLKLCLHLQDLRNHDCLTGWLGAVTRQECFRLHRRRVPESLEVAESLASDMPSPEENVLRAERAHLLRHAFAELPPDCQNLLGMLYQAEPVPYADAAKSMGIPVGSIGPRRARCLERLKKKMESQDL